jgi:DNA segregation ATPase FtsK/SpoIIIE-like protein
MAIFKSIKRLIGLKDHCADEHRDDFDEGYNDEVNDFTLGDESDFESHEFNEDELDEDELDEDELDENELDENELDENELDENELDENELDENELDENELDENELDEEIDIDKKYSDVIRHIKTTHNASRSKVQSKFWMSANRAALIIDAIETAGIIGAINDHTIYDDPTYDDVVKFVIKTRSVSAKVIQHVFSLNTHRTKIIFDAMEAVGVISENRGGKRFILV